MKSLYLLVLVTLCQGVTLETRAAQLSAPYMIKVTVLNPPAIQVSWNKIDSGDVQDPVLGYKVKVWTVRNIKSTKYIFVNGELKQVEEEKEEPIVLISSPDGTPDEILSSAEETSAIYHNVKLDVTYEVRVQAFTKNNDGPMSAPIRIKLDKD